MGPWSVTKGRGHPTWDNFLVHDINISNAMSLLPYMHNIKPPICKPPINLDDTSILEARTSPLICNSSCVWQGLHNPSQHERGWERLHDRWPLIYESPMLRSATQRLQKCMLRKSDHGSVTMKYDIGKMASDTRQLHGPRVNIGLLTHEHLITIRMRLR